MTNQFTPSARPSQLRFRGLMLTLLCLVGLLQAQNPTEIILYADPAYGGQSVTLGIGTYPDISTTGFPLNTLSSYKIGADVYAYPHSCLNFVGGVNTLNAFTMFDPDVLAQSPSLAGNSWDGIVFAPYIGCSGSTLVDNDTKALLVLGKNCTPGPNEVALFEGAGYTRGCKVVGVGDYVSMPAAGLLNDWATSLKVGANVKVSVFHDIGFGGTTTTYSKGTNVTDLAATIGSNNLSSFKIEPDAAVTWNNNTGNTQWSTPGNWTGGPPPTPPSDVVFNATSPSDVNVDVDVEINSLTVNTDYPGTINLGNKNLSVKQGISIPQPPSLNAGTGTIKLIKGQPVNVKPPLHNLIFSTTTPTPFNILKTVAVNNKLTINSPVTLLNNGGGEAIEVEGDLEINAPMPPPPSPLTNAPITIKGTLNQNVKTKGLPHIKLQKPSGQAILSDNSEAQSLEIVSGTLHLNQKTLTVPTPVNFPPSSVLTGKGTINTPKLTMKPSAMLKPGSSPGTLTVVGDLEMEPGADLEFEIAPAGVDMVGVQGAVSIGGANLDIQASGPAPPPSITVIDNDGTEPVYGTFAGLPEGSPVPVSGMPYHISYVGGTGNDVVLSSCSSGNILYVKGSAAGANNGTSWANAYTDLQAALANTCPGITEIWVAAGTYKPTSGTDKGISFIMKNDLAIYGGFPNTGNPGFGNRNWTTNVTTLSGDINTPNNNSDNSYHVIFNNDNGLNNTAILDGFTITGGNANGGYPNNYGGGMYNKNSSPSAANCSFAGNSASDSGGGMYNFSFASPSVTNCRFTGNSASYGGGGMFNNIFSSPSVTNCSFAGNSASVGGGVYNYIDCSTTMKNCILWGNSSGILTLYSPATTVSYSIVQGGYTGTGNLNVNPLFVSQPPVGLGTGGDLHLQSCSPAIDAGTAIGAPATDLDGNPRPVNSGFDMGAYEFQGAPPPTVAACQNQTVFLDNTGSASLAVSNLNNGSTGCGPLAFSVGGQPTLNFTCASVGNIPVTLTVTNSLGNTATCAATVTIVDNTLPTAICQNLTVSLAGASASITASQINNGSSDNCSFTLSVSPTSFNCSNVGPNNVTLTVTAGTQSATCTAVVTVVDNTLPVAICQYVTVYLNASGNGSTTAAVVNNGSSDACGIASLSLSPSSFTCANVGPNTVTLTVTDVNSNSSTCTATVTVVDNIAPVAVCQPVTVQLNNLGNGSTTAAAVNNGSTDACGIASLSLNNSSFTCANVGSGNTVTLTVTDNNSNSSTCNATVTVVDNTPPSAVCKNHTVALGAGGTASIAPADVFQSGSDNCGTVNQQSVSPNSFTCANLGSNTVTLTVNDGRGNTNTCSATVTVTLDNTTAIAYGLLAQEEVHMHKTTVNGNVGVWQAGKDAKIHEYSIVNGFVKAPVIDLDNNAAINGAQLLAQAPQPGSFRYNTQADPPSDVNVPDNYLGVYQLTGNLFRKIEVGKNSTVQFMASGDIFIKEFKTKDSDNGNHSSVLLSGNTELIIRKRLELGKRTLFNWGGASGVKAYVEEEDVKVKELCKVNASIDVRFKNLNTDDGDQTDHTLMRGQFIAKKIDSQKWVDWNWAPFECGGSSGPGNLIGPAGDLGLVATMEEIQVKLQWVTDLDGDMEVERSTDGANFAPVLYREASAAAKSYNGYDLNPEVGVNYYRVKQLNTDGSPVYSPVRQVVFSPGSDFTVFPNPGSDRVSVYMERFMGKEVDLVISNNLGQELYRQHIPEVENKLLQLELDRKIFAEGMYTISIVRLGRAQSKRLVVLRAD